MPNKKLTYEIAADTSKAVSNIKKLGTAGKDAGEDIERGLGGGFEDAESAGTRALATLSSKLDGLESDIKGTASAVKAISDNLDDGFDASRIEAMVGDLRKMGVTFDEIEAKAKEFADVIQRVDGIKLDAVNSGLTNVGSSLDKVTGSADQSRSVMANMAGNAAQDLGELGGVAGTAGVALGQLAEYATEGNISLANLAKVAGPMAALAGATALVSQAIGAVKAEDAFNAEMVEDFTDALREGETVAGQLRDTILETGELEFATGLFGGGGFLGISSEMQNLIPLFNELGINYDEFMQLLADPTGYEQLRALRDTWLDMALNAPTDALADVWTAHAEAANLAAEGLKTYKENTDQAVIAQEVFAQFIEGTAAEVTKLDKSLKTMADGAVEAQAAQGELYETLRDGNLELGAWVTATDVAAERATAFAEALEDLNSASELTLSQRIIDLSDGIHGFGEALQEANEAGVEWSEIDFIPDTWEEVQDMPDDLRGVVESFAGMRDQIQGELAAAFETGGTSGLLTAVGTLRTAIINELKAAGITGAAELKAALEALGLDDQTIEILIEVSGQEQARQALAGIQGTIDSLVDAGLIGIQTSVDIAAVAVTDPKKALAMAIAALEQAGLTVPAELEVLTQDAKVKVRQFTSGVHPPTYVDVEANTDPADEDLRGFAGQSRSVTFTTDADNSGAEKTLSGLKTPKAVVQSEVDSSSYWTTDATLDRLADPRHVYYYTHTVGSATGGRLPQDQAAPTAATTAATTTATTATSTAPVAAGNRTTNINVNVNTAALGNRYEVQRMLRVAVRDLERLGQL